MHTSHSVGHWYTRMPPPCHPHPVEGLGPPSLTISEAVLGLAPSGEPPSSREQSGPASSSYSVRQSDSSPGTGEQGKVNHAGWPNISISHGSQPQLRDPPRCPWALTISTAVRNVARGGLNPGHNLRQVSEARAGEGQHLGSGTGEGLGHSLGLWSVRGCGVLGPRDLRGTSLV